jgi:hypothetical protein
LLQRITTQQIIPDAMHVLMNVVKKMVSLLIDRIETHQGDRRVQLEERFTKLFDTFKVPLAPIKNPAEEVSFVVLHHIHCF